MPESTTIDAPAGSSQTVTGPTGIADFAAEMAATVKSASAPAPEPKPAAPAKEAPAPEKPAEAPPSKPAETTPATTPTAKEKPMAEWTQEDFDSAMKKAPSKAWKVYEFYKQKTESKISEAEKRISDIQSKPVESPGDAKKIEAYEKQIKELSEQTNAHLKTIAELDYSRSPEFRRQYTDRLTSAYQTAIEEIKQLTVSEADETNRPATQQDFDLLMRLPVREQILRAKQMFGDAADAFFGHRNEINRIQREGREALTRVQDEAESKRTQAEAQSKESQRLYESTLESEHTNLVSQFPELFGDTDNQEAATAMQKGLEFSKQLLIDRDKASPQDKAAIDAALQATHAGFRRMVVEGKAKDSKIEALEKELEKYRKSDPGKEDLTGKGGGAPADADEIGGIDQAASKFVPVR